MQKDPPRMVDAGGLYPAAGRWDRNSVQLPIGLLLLDYRGIGNQQRRDLAVQHNADHLDRGDDVYHAGAPFQSQPAGVAQRNVDHRLRLLCDGRAF